MSLDFNDLPDKDWDAIMRRFRLRVDSYIESEVARQLAMADHPCPITYFKENELRQMIGSLKPTDEMKAGREFLNRLLDDKGVIGLDQFMEKANLAIRIKGRLHKDNFSEYEKDLYEQCKPDLSRRKVLVGIASAAGLGLMGHGLSLVGKQLVEEETHEPPPKERWRRYVKNTVHGMEVLAPGVEISGAAVILGYAYKEYWDAKFEQVCSAISGLSELTQRKNVIGR